MYDATTENQLLQYVIQLASYIATVIGMQRSLSNIMSLYTTGRAYAIEQ